MLIVMCYLSTRPFSSIADIRPFLKPSTGLRALLWASLGDDLNGQMDHFSKNKQLCGSLHRLQNLTIKSRLCYHHYRRRHICPQVPMIKLWTGQVSSIFDICDLVHCRHIWPQVLHAYQSCFLVQEWKKWGLAIECRNLSLLQ